MKRDPIVFGVSLFGRRLQLVSIEPERAAAWAAAHLFKASEPRKGSLVIEPTRLGRAVFGGLDVLARLLG